MKKKSALLILLVITSFLSRQLLAGPEGGGSGAHSFHSEVAKSVKSNSKTTAVSSARGGEKGAVAGGFGASRTEAYATARRGFDFGHSIAVSRSDLNSPKTISLLNTGHTVATLTGCGCRIFVTAKPAPGSRNGFSSLAVSPREESMASFLVKYLPYFTGRSATATRNDVDRLIGGNTLVLPGATGGRYSMTVLNNEASTQGNIVIITPIDQTASGTLAFL
jgi:hypothetical protein